jgi:hypothetical protein
MSADGTLRPGAKEPNMTQEELIKFYKLMVHLNVSETALSTNAAACSVVDAVASALFW